MVDIEAGSKKLCNIEKINVLLGKNGCGKSRFFREVEEKLRTDNDFGKISYIPPERGGQLTFNPTVEKNISTNPNWQRRQRRTNRVGDFRQQTISQYRNLEKLSLRELEQDDEIRNSSYTFDEEVDRINKLLDQIKIVREDEDFSIYDNSGESDERESGQISSGESELITLAIEILVFAKQINEDKENILFLDEPDVHIHPDLQERICSFIIDLVKEHDFRVFIATHSTAILGSVSDYKKSKVCFMNYGDETLNFECIDEVYRKILPVFGAHPLSNIFNQDPILLVDGEDDVRIWQQAIRSSEGEINLFPISVNGTSYFSDFEDKVQDILKSIYDDPLGFSLRDKDEQEGELDDLSPIKRFRLNCKEAENLLISDEVLTQLDTNWSQLREGIEKWLNENEGHNHHDTMRSFEQSSFDRKGFKIKEIRNDIMGIIGDNRPWEVAVGQAISGILTGSLEIENTENSLVAYLSEQFLSEIHPSFSPNH